MRQVPADIDFSAKPYSLHTEFRFVLCTRLGFACKLFGTVSYNTLGQCSDTSVRHSSQLLLYPKIAITILIATNSSQPMLAIPQLPSQSDSGAHHPTSLKKNKTHVQYKTKPEQKDFSFCFNTEKWGNFTQRKLLIKKKISSGQKLRWKLGR